MSDDLPVVATFGTSRSEQMGLSSLSGTVPLPRPAWNTRVPRARSEPQGLRTAASLPFIGLGLILAAFGLIALVSGVWLIGLLLVVCGGLAIWAGEYNKKRKVMPKW